VVIHPATYSTGKCGGLGAKKGHDWSERGSAYGAAAVWQCLRGSAYGAVVQTLLAQGVNDASAG
jgi:hypothetical protein